jgi:16S rRNA (guanine1207-N2)-methyltransferase
MASAYLPLLAPVRPRLRGPALVILGSPRTAADVAEALAEPGTVCWQLDRFAADRLADELRERQISAAVACSADVWDQPPAFGCAVFPAAQRGERELKLDVVEQAYHVLRPHGVFAVLSPVPRDQVFPPAMKKQFRKVALETSRDGTVLWSACAGARKRRRHETTYSAKVGEGRYIELISRPGLFSYGRLDDGTRSLLDVLETRPAERIIDLGCGGGAAGIVAALRSGDGAHVTLADSNARAVQVAGLNASAVGVADYAAVLTTDFAELPGASFDLALANPPYFAGYAVAQLFAEQARRLLRPRGRLYLVSRLPESILPALEELFPAPLILGRRDYAIVIATRRA